MFKKVLASSASLMFVSFGPAFAQKDSNWCIHPSTNEAAKKLLAYKNRWLSLKNGARFTLRKDMVIANLEFCCACPQTAPLTKPGLSVSKHMVATGIMLYLNTGRETENCQDPVSKVLSGRSGQTGAKITSRHLLKSWLPDAKRVNRPFKTDGRVQPDSLLIQSRLFIPKSLVYETGNPPWQ